MECTHPLIVDGRCASCARPVQAVAVLPHLEHELGVWPGPLRTRLNVDATRRRLEVTADHVCPCGVCYRLTPLDDLTDSLCPSCHADRKALA